MTAAARVSGSKDAGISIAPVYADQFRRPDVAVDVLAFRLDVDATTRALAETLLSDDERQRASRFAHDRDHRRYAVARAYLRQSLAQRTGIEPAAIRFRYGAHGKPELAPEHGASNIRFNLSHSGEMAALALSAGYPVGIDIEHIRPMSDLDRLARGSFSISENDALRAVAPAQRLLSFFNCWTRKEAFVKAIGSGLGTPLDTFDVSLAPDEPARILRVSKEHGDVSDWHIEGFSPAHEYVAAVAVDARAV